MVFAIQIKNRKEQITFTTMQASNKKQKTSKKGPASKVVKLGNLDVSKVKFSSVGALNPTMKTIFVNTDGMKLAIQLDSNGESRVHQSFGVTPSMKGDTVNITITLTTEMAEQLERLQSHIMEHVVSKRAECFGPTFSKTDDEIRAMFTPLVPQAKETGTGSQYPRTLKMPVDPTKLKQSSSDHEHDVTVLVGDQYIFCDAGMPAEETLKQLEGLPWTKAIFQLTLVYIQGSMKIGISRRLAYLECKDVQAGEIRPLGDDE